MDKYTEQSPSRKGGPKTVDPTSMGGFPGALAQSLPALPKVRVSVFGTYREKSGLYAGLKVREVEQACAAFRSRWLLLKAKPISGARPGCGMGAHSVWGIHPGVAARFCLFVVFGLPT